MSDPADTAPLQRAPDLRVEVGRGGELTVISPRGRASVGAHGLAALDAFARPCSPAEALARLGALGGDPGALPALVARLRRAGALEPAEGQGPALRPDAGTYDSAPIHVAMLDDRTRVERFLAAIRDVVRPGDVVLDLGTGIGVFAIAAAQAGARHVYAVEAGAIARLARANVAANGLADRVTVLQGWSTQIALPERADVLISEMVGNEPTHDFMLEVMRDARRRLLKPGARLVPQRVRIYGLPLAIPDEALAREAVTPAVASGWGERYGLDLGHLAEPPGGGDRYGILVRPYEAAAWPALGEPALLADLDMGEVGELMLDLAIPFTATAAGALNGLLVYFETQLSAASRLSLHPAAAQPDSFRYTPVHVLRRPLAVAAGERLVMTYHYRVRGVRDGLGVTRA